MGFLQLQAMCNGLLSFNVVLPVLFFFFVFVFFVFLNQKKKLKAFLLNISVLFTVIMGELLIQ